MNRFQLLLLLILSPLNATVDQQDQRGSTHTVTSIYENDSFVLSPPTSWQNLFAVAHSYQEPRLKGYLLDLLKLKGEGIYRMRIIVPIPKVAAQGLRKRICEEILGGPSLVKVPIQSDSNTSTTKKVYECKLCFNKYTERDLKVHMKIHDNRYECPLCFFQCSSNLNLRNHNKRVHRGENTFLCSYPSCQKRFRVKRDCITHEKPHENSSVW